MDRAEEHPVVLFDGVCNLCNASVRFLVKRDPKGVLRFASLQSEAARRILGPLDIEERQRGWRQGGAPESVILVENGRVFEHSTAALRIATHLPHPLWRLAAILRIVPRPIRDAVYRLIARRRYSWFGRTQVCPIPSPELRGRFLEDG